MLDGTCIPRSLEKYSSNHAKNVSLSCADILVQSIVGSWEIENPIMGGRVARTMGGGPAAEGAVGTKLRVGGTGDGDGAADDPRGGSGGVDAGPRGGRGGEDTGPRGGKGGEDTGPRDGKGGAVDPVDLLEDIEGGMIEPVRLGGGGNGASSAGLDF